MGGRFVFASAAIAVGLLAQGPAQAADNCQVFVRAAGGAFRHQAVPTLVVTTLAPDEAFVIPPDVPRPVEFVQCRRQALLPGANDYKVLSAGFPLSIVAGKRVGVLELAQGHVRFRMLEGQLTDAENQQLAPVLADFARALDTPAPATP